MTQMSTGWATHSFCNTKNTFNAYKHPSNDAKKQHQSDGTFSYHWYAK